MTQTSQTHILINGLSGLNLYDSLRDLDTLESIMETLNNNENRFIQAISIHEQCTPERNNEILREVREIYKLIQAQELYNHKTKLARKN